MTNTTQQIAPLFAEESIRTNTTLAGQKFCHIPNQGAPEHIKPLTFLISDDRNQVEDFILTNTLHALYQRLGYLPSINILNGKSNAATQKQCFDHVVSSGLETSAVIGLSPWMAFGAHHHLTMNGVFVPVLFANVSANDQHNLSKHAWINGVATQVQNYQRQLRTIKDLLPDLRRVLIPHDMMRNGTQSNTNKSGNLKSLTAECIKQGLEPILLSIPPESKIPVDIRQFDSKETLFVLTRENSVMNQMEAIIDTCNGHRMPIFSDLPLGTLHGAAFGTGTSGIQLAQPLAEMIYQVIEHERLPASLQTTLVGESNLLLYNNMNFQRQGVQVSDMQLRLLEAQHIMLYAQNQLML